MFYEYNQVPDKISGVYRIIFPNDKNYIGISNNIRRRMMEHFGADINKKPELPISRALLKYGITNIKIEIIEKIDSYNRFFMREREKYWIKYYNSLIHLNGYNVSCGGDGADVGENNHEALLSASQLCEIIKDLKESTLTIKEIADKYNVNDYVISRINNGHTYFNKENSYPIRKRHVKKQGLENKNSKFYNNLELFENIRTDLLYSTLSAKEITEKYSISPSLLHNINYGKIGYKIKGQLYPIRIFEHNTNKRIFTEEEIVNIYNLLKNKEMSMSQIGNNFGCDRKVISDLNKGLRQPQNNFLYPIRKTK